MDGTPGGEIRAAASRILAYTDGPAKSVDVRDLRTVAIAHLADHLADDAEPVTHGDKTGRQWLDTISVPKLIDWNYRVDTDDLYLEVWMNGWWHNIPLPKNPTRGAVRRILAALGMR